jgi:hypothetical protein
MPETLSANAKLSSRLTREKALKTGEPSVAWPVGSSSIWFGP